MPIVLIAVGGAAGAVARYLVDVTISQRWPSAFPWGTLAVNLSGSLGLAGATVIRGIEGFGAKQHLHTTRILSLSTDLPVLIEVVDQEDRLRAVLPELEAMVSDGLITLERVEVIAYRAQGGEGG